MCVCRRDVDACTRAIQQLQQEVATLRKGLLLVHAASVRPQQWATKAIAPQATQEAPLADPLSGQAPGPEQQPQMDMRMPVPEPPDMNAASGPVHQEGMEFLSAEAVSLAAQQKQPLDTSAMEGYSATTLPQMRGPEA